jgi:hypothetical protein
VAIVNPARQAFFAGHIHAARVEIGATTAAAICADPAAHYVQLLHDPVPRRSHPGPAHPGLTGQNEA